MSARPTTTEEHWYHLEYYRDKRNKWRWRLSSANGKIVGASTQGYSRRGDAVENFDFSALDISEVTEQIDYVVTNDAGETLVLGDLGNFGDQGDANIDVQTFETIEFTTTDGMGNNVVIDMDAGEFRQDDGDILFTFDSATTFDFSAITEDMEVAVVDTAMVGVTIITDPMDTVTGGGGDSTEGPCPRSAEPLLPLPHPESSAAERRTGTENFNRSRKERDMEPLLVIRRNTV